MSTTRTMTGPRGPQWLRSDQVAAMLGVSERALEGRRYRGTGPPFVRLSPRRLLYERGQVEAWLAERSTSDRA